MKKIVVSFVMLVIGFISGIYAILRLIIWSDGTLHGFKVAIIERFEYLLLGYNTIKGPRKAYYHSSYARRPYSNYRDYYGDKGFEEDEEEECDER